MTSEGGSRPAPSAERTTGCRLAFSRMTANHVTRIRRPCRASPLPPPPGDRPYRAGRAARRRQPTAAPASCNPRAAAWRRSEWRHALAQHGIRNAEDHGLAHKGMAQKDALDLDRRDVGPAADDEILLAADEPQL